MMPEDATKPRVSPAANVVVAVPGLPPKQRKSALLTSDTAPLSREFWTLVRRTESQSAASGCPLTMSLGNLSDGGVSLLSYCLPESE